MGVGTGLSVVKLLGRVKRGRKGMSHRFKKLNSVSHSKRGIKGKAEKENLNAQTDLEILFQ